MGFFSKKETSDGEGRTVNISRTGNPTARPVLVRIWGMVGCLIITSAFVTLIIIVQKRLPDGSKSTFHPTWKEDRVNRLLFAGQTDTNLPETVFGIIPPISSQITSMDNPAFGPGPSGDCWFQTVNCSEKYPGCYTYFIRSCSPTDSFTSSSMVITSVPEITSSVIISSPGSSLLSPEITLTPSSTEMVPDSCLFETVICESETSCYKTYDSGPCTPTSSQNVPISTATITSPPSSTTSTGDLTSLAGGSVDITSDTFLSSPSSATSTIEVTLIPSGSATAPSDTATLSPSPTSPATPSIIITASPSLASSTILDICFSETLICPSKLSCYNTLVPVPCTSMITSSLITSTTGTSSPIAVITAPPSSESITSMASPITITSFDYHIDTCVASSEACYLSYNSDIDDFSPVCETNYSTMTGTACAPDFSPIPDYTTQYCMPTAEVTCYEDYDDTVLITFCSTYYMTATEGMDCGIPDTRIPTLMIPSTSVSGTLLTSVFIPTSTPRNPSAISTVTTSSSYEICVRPLRFCNTDESWDSENNRYTRVCEPSTDFLTMTDTACGSAPTSLPYCTTEDVYCFLQDGTDEDEGGVATICETSYLTRTDAECGPTSYLSPTVIPTSTTMFDSPSSSTNYQPTLTSSPTAISVENCLSTDILCSTYYPDASIGAVIAGMGGFATDTGTPEPVVGCTTVYNPITNCGSRFSLSSSSSSAFISNSSISMATFTESSETPSSASNFTSNNLMPSSTSSTPPVSSSSASSETIVLPLPSITSAPISASVSGPIDSIETPIVSGTFSSRLTSSTRTASKSSDIISRSSIAESLIDLVIIAGNNSTLISQSKTPSTAILSPIGSTSSSPAVLSSVTNTLVPIFSMARSSMSGSTTLRPASVLDEATSTEPPLFPTQSTELSSEHLESSTLCRSSQPSSHVSHQSSSSSKIVSSKSNDPASIAAKSTDSKYTVSRYTTSKPTASNSISNISAEPQISSTHIATSTIGSVAPSPSFSEPTDNVTDSLTNLIPSIFPLSKIVIGDYVPLITARVFTAILTSFYNGILLFEPIRQLSNPNGAPYAALAGNSGIEIPIHVAMLVANLGSGFAAGATFLDTSYCQRPPCTPKLSANPWVMDVVIGTLAIQALAITIMISQWWRKPSGLSVDPTSIAGVAVVMGHPKIDGDFQSIPADMKASELKRRLKGESYKLGTFMTATGMIKFGVMPAPVDPDQPLKKERGPGFFSKFKDRIPFVDNWRNNKLYFDALFLIFLLALLGLTCAALSHINKPQVVFLATAAASGTGIRIFLAILGIIVSNYWGMLFRDMQTFAPYVDLGRGDAEPDSTVLLHKQTFPITAFLPLLFKGHYTAASVAFTGFTAEFLILALAGMPYRPGQAQGEFIFWSCISLFILILMVIQLLLVVYWRRKLPLLYRAPDTIASVMAYVAGTGMARDFEGLSTMGTKERDRTVKGWGKKYVYGWRREGAEGRVRWVVDDGRAKDLNVGGQELRRTGSF